ncbi:MAG TPA: class I tRNA ligase family protein [Dissulfurispiraceae bacterium]|nr:class I tRNA ligase family protein [Dissulfurispiraceae bacterium]
MLRLFNTDGRRIETFRPVDKEVVTIFTCGPSVYQRAHIGNMRTFLFEDVLVRYLEYRGYTVKRGMIITDIEDKALREAEKEGTTVKRLTDRNIGQFLKETDALGMKRPDYLPRASEHVAQAVAIIQELLKRKVAYRHNGSVYFDPMRFKGFGKLYGLDMSTWPKKRRRFHLDTYPGVQWNRGDFILWHGCPGGDDGCWESSIGRGRPSWNVQDASTLLEYFEGTLSIYCGGIDNLYRHHDYSIAILESVRPYPMARYWLHAYHLYVGGHKMSKSRGNIIYTDMLLKGGNSYGNVRFYLIDGHYRDVLNFRENRFEQSARRLAMIKGLVRPYIKRAGNADPAGCASAARIAKAFVTSMDDDLQVAKAVDAVYAVLKGTESSALSEGQAAAVVDELRKIDSVLRVLFNSRGTINK